MSRECIVCGRNLKTGRKYCYEHRGYYHSEESINERKLNKIHHLTTDFVKNDIGWYYLFMHRYSFEINIGILIFSFLVGLFINIDKPVLEIAIYVAIPLIILSFFLSIKTSIKIKESNNKNEEIEEHIISKVQEEREEKAYIDDLLE